ncbi:hypothetical protein [Streptomyces sp. A012304]|nr:hypothetical protein [Streptomyces sp. A012304]
MSKPSTATGLPDEPRRRLGVPDAVVIGLGFGTTTTANAVTSSS